MSGALVFTSCTASKDDSVPIAAKGIAIGPDGYVADRDLRDLLLSTREQVLSDPRAKRGNHLTDAFHLYTRTGRMYKGLYSDIVLHTQLNRALEQREVEWFFLSGGYGILHALEPATKYQATFSYGIARQNGIPYTADLWRRCLVDICEHVTSHYPTWPVYVFGSQDYTTFVKDTQRWQAHDGIKIFESTGSVGGSWLSPTIVEFVRSLLFGELSKFNDRYCCPFVKQPR